MVCRRSPWDIDRYRGDHYWPASCRTKLLETMDREPPTNLAWIGRQPMRKNRLTHKEKNLNREELQALERRAEKRERKENAGRGGSPYKTLFAATANSTEFGETSHSLESWERRKWTLTQPLPTPTGFTDTEMDMRGRFTDYDTATPLTSPSPYATTQGSVWFQNTQGPPGPMPRKPSHSGSDAAFQNTQGSGFYSTRASLPRMEEDVAMGDISTLPQDSTTALSAEASARSPVLDPTDAPDQQGLSRVQKMDNMVADLQLRVEAATGEVYHGLVDSEAPA